MKGPKQFIMVVALLTVIAVASLLVSKRIHANRKLGHLNNEAVAHINRGDYGQAVQLLEQARLMSPGSVSVWRNLGRAYEGLGKFDKAREAYGMALKGRPNDHEIVNALERIDKDCDLLRQRAKKRVQRMRTEGWTDYKISKQTELDKAESMRQVEDYRQAVEHLGRALFLDPSDLSLELQIEVFEEKAETMEKRQNAQRKAQNEIGP